MSRARHAVLKQHAGRSRIIPSISGDDIEKAIPDPIPNSEVKLFGANGTARETVWESRTLPEYHSIPLTENYQGYFFLERHSAVAVDALQLKCVFPGRKTDGLRLRNVHRSGFPDR